MLDWTVFRVELEPISSMHFGSHLGDMGRSEATLRSDSLFGAFVEGVAATAGPSEAGDLVAAFAASEPPWLHSSLLLARAGSTFYPRPFASAAWVASIDPTGRKRTKGARWVTEKALARWWDGEEWEPTASGDGVAIGIAGETVLEGALYRSNRVARVTMARDNQSTALFSAGLVTFAPDVRLVLMVAAPGRFPAVLEHALGYLERVGIGGERSTGNGRFKLSSIETTPLNAGVGARGGYSLSCIAPGSADIETGILGETASYGVVSRRGWIASPSWGGFHSRDAVMLQEGSSLPASARDIPGRLVDVTPLDDGRTDRHPVFRYGLGLLLPIGGDHGG